MKYILLAVMLPVCTIALHAQDNVSSSNGKQSMETTKSKKEAMKEKEALAKVHEKDQATMDKQQEEFNKKKYKKDLKSKAK